MLPNGSHTQDDDQAITARANEAELGQKINELVCYLWDNYLEGYESTDIVLMGVGYSYLGVKMLLTSRGEPPSPSSSYS
jgi:histone deacetylase 6